MICESFANEWVSERKSTNFSNMKRHDIDNAARV